MELEKESEKRIRKKKQMIKNRELNARYKKYGNNIF